VYAFGYRLLKVRTQLHASEAIEEAIHPVRGREWDWTATKWGEDGDEGWEKNVMNVYRCVNNLCLCQCPFICNTYSLASHPSGGSGLTVTFLQLPVASYVFRVQ
jgi:hypothetical protein